MSMHNTHETHRPGLHNPALRTVALVLVALMIASVVGIWQTSANITPLGTVSVYVSPASKSAAPGETFTVQVLINAGQNAVQAADVHLTFDPTYLQLTGNPTAGDLTSVSGVRHDNTAGTLDLGVYTAGTPATGSIVLCTLSFEAQAVTSGTLIQQNSAWSPSVLVAGPVGATHSVTWSNGSVVISEPQPPTATNTMAPPTATKTSVPPTATNTPLPPTPTPTTTDEPPTPLPTATDTPSTGSLCVTVFYDGNLNGQRDAGEMLLPGAIVRILNPSGTLMVEYVSDAVNQPRCTVLSSGIRYTVEVTPPDGYTGTEPQTASATVGGGRATALDFGETSPLGVPTAGAGQILLPLIMRNHPPAVTGDDPMPDETLDRFGVAMFRGHGLIEDYPLDRLRFGWYVDWWYQVDVTKPDSLLYARIVPVDSYYKSDPQDPLWASIRASVEAAPGAIWLIGNEPECVHQGNRTPEEYAAIYHTYYTFLKGLDPTCKIGIGGVVQPTPLRLEWLDLCLAAYETVYGAPMPVDIWNIHNMILDEVRDQPGCDIPVGLPDERGVTPQWTNNDSMDIFSQQIVDFRTWMLANGQRDKPLYVSEYGIMFASSWFDGLGGASGDDRVKTFMSATFDYMLTATDPALGCPSDDNHLVQRWAWLSLNSPTFEKDPIDGYNGNLCDQDTHTMTTFGEYYESLLNGYLAASGL